MHVHAVGRGPTVVMLHGFAMEGRSWLPSVLPLARQFRFVLPDLRGFGRSHSVPFARADVIEGFADDLEDLLDHLGERRVFLAGLSMGALTSLAFAARGGFARIAGYVHVDQAARIHNDESYAHGLFGPSQTDRFAALRALHALVEPYRDRPFAEMPEALRLGVRSAFVAFFRAAFHAPLFKGACSLVVRESVMKRVVPLERWSAYTDCMKSYLDGRHDYTLALAKAHAAEPIPLTFMVGDRSEMYPAAGQLELARIVQRETSREGRVEVIQFPRTGHAVPMEAPVQFVRALGRAIHRAMD
jgi:pimeloyl-ACP methyl ester carboxylesterase